MSLHEEIKCLEAKARQADSYRLALNVIANATNFGYCDLSDPANLQRLAEHVRKCVGADAPRNKVS